MFVGHPILEEIRQGCHLRPTKTIDKSKPMILVEGENLKEISRLKPRPEPLNPPTPPAVLPPVPPNAPVLPPPPVRKTKPVTNPTLLKLGGKQNVDREELLRKIRDGVQLRKVVTVDKSAPAIVAEGEIPKIKLLSSHDQAEDQPVASSQQPLNHDSDSAKHSLENAVTYSGDEDTTVKAANMQPANFSDSPNHHLPYTTSQPAPPAPPPPPPPMPSYFNTLPRAQKPSQPDVFDVHEHAMDNTLPRTKKADECYTSPIPTREMIEAEIPTGSASNRIKLLNSLHCRAQSQSPVRTVHRPPPPKCPHPGASAFEQQNGAVDGGAQNRSTKFPSSLYRRGDNQSLGDVSSIKAMAQRFDGNFNVNGNANLTPMHRSLANNFHNISSQKDQQQTDTAAKTKQQGSEQREHRNDEVQPMIQKMNHPEHNNYLKVYEGKQISSNNGLSSPSQQPVINNGPTRLNGSAHLPASSEPSAIEKSRSTYITPLQNQRVQTAMNKISNFNPQQSVQFPAAISARSNQSPLVSAASGSTISTSHNTTAPPSVNSVDQRNNLHSSNTSAVIAPSHTNSASSTSFLPAPKVSSSFNQNSSTSLCILPTAASTDLSILPNKNDVQKPKQEDQFHNSSSISKYSIPIQVDTDDTPPPIPTSVPPKMPSPGQANSLIHTDGSPHSSSSSKTGSGRYRYIKQIGSHSPSSSSYGTPSSHSFISPSPSSHSNISPVPYGASQTHSPSSSNSDSPRGSESKPFGSGSLRSSGRSYASSGTFESASEDFPAEEVQPRRQQFISPAPKPFFLKNSRAGSTNSLEQEQAPEGTQWTPITASRSNPHLEPQEESPAQSKTYSVPILAPWYDPQKYGNNSSTSEVIHFGKSRDIQANDHRESPHQGVGRAHKIIIGMGDTDASRYANMHPDVFNANYKFSINLSDEEPLRIVPR